MNNLKIFNFDSMDKAYNAGFNEGLQTALRVLENVLNKKEISKESEMFL